MEPNHRKVFGTGFAKWFKFNSSDYTSGSSDKFKKNHVSYCWLICCHERSEVWLLLFSSVIDIPSRSEIVYTISTSFSMAVVMRYLPVDDKASEYQRLTFLTSDVIFLMTTIIDRLTRVERTYYEMGDRQRSERW